MNVSKHVRRSSGKAGREVLSDVRPTIYEGKRCLAVFVRSQRPEWGAEWSVELASGERCHIIFFATRSEALGFWEALP